MNITESPLEQLVDRKLCLKAILLPLIYAAGWLVLFKTPYVDSVDTGLMAWTLITATGLFVQIFLYLRREDLTQSNPYLWRNLVSVLAINAALCWGVVTAALTSDGSSLVVFSITTIIGITGVVAFSSRLGLTVLFVLGSFLPTILVNSSTLSDPLLAHVTVCIFLLLVAKWANVDFWKNLENMVLVDNQAKELAQLITIDPLTSTKNRRYFDAQLSAEWKRAIRHQKTVSLLMIDIDFFKNINDTHGHQCGDLALKVVSRVLTKCVLRSSDFVARYGGEEFVIVLPETPFSESSVVAERIRKSIESSAFSYEGQEIKLTLSIGIASGIPQSHTNPEELVKLADNALYQAKAEGRNTIRKRNLNQEPADKQPD